MSVPALTLVQLTLHIRRPLPHQARRGGSTSHLQSKAALGWARETHGLVEAPFDPRKFLLSRDVLLALGGVDEAGSLPYSRQRTGHSQGHGLTSKLQAQQSANRCKPRQCEQAWRVVWKPEGRNDRDGKHRNPPPNYNLLEHWSLPGALAMSRAQPEPGPDATTGRNGCSLGGRKDIIR
jgi:hypothetical protein